MSYIRFLHGSTGMDDVTVFVGGMPVTRQLQYGESTPHFLMAPGQTVIRVEENGRVRLQNHVIIPKDQAYTLLFVDRRGFPEMIPISEGEQAPAEGMGGVRLAAFSDAAQMQELWSRSQDQEELLFSQAVQGDVTEYVQLETGEYRWEIREGGSTISILPGQIVQDGELYSLYLIGRSDPEEIDRPIAIAMLKDVKTAIAQLDTM